MIKVQFDNAMSSVYDANDLTAMVLDKDPNPKDLVVGTQVVARYPKESVHVEGKVKQEKKENEKKTFLIEFWDGVEHWNSFEQIRFLTTTKPGGIEPVHLLYYLKPCCWLNSNQCWHGIDRFGIMLALTSISLVTRTPPDKICSHIELAVTNMCINGRLPCWMRQP